MSSPKISIIIPSYNQEKYIEECFFSILCQSFPDFEIIAVDDGSTDSTLSILRRYEREDSRVRVFEELNKGAGAARNFGLSLAKGDYVLFMDSDDFLIEDALEVLSALADTASADIYFYNFRTFDDSGGEYSDTQTFGKQELTFSTKSGVFGYSKTSFNERKEFFIWSYVAPWNKLYNREFLIKNGLEFDEIFSTNDRAFYFSTLATSTTIVTTDACLINYRINNVASLTGSYNEAKFRNRVFAYDSSLKWLDLGDSTVREAFFKVTVLDFVSFYQKTSEEHKYRVFNDTRRFFKGLDTSGISCLERPDDLFGFYYNFFVESDYLEGIPGEKIIPIVFATNDGYLPYLAVALRSVMDNTSKDFFYDVYVLHSGLDPLNIFKLVNMGCENLHIRAVNVDPLVKSLPLYPKSHFSVEMYYRILIPELLWQYNKVIYLDCDLIAKTDLSRMYEISLDGNILAAVRNPLDDHMSRYVADSLGMDVDLYFNSGVLVIDVNLFKERDVKKRCFELLAKHKRLACPDQDVLNLSCINKCRYLDETWNFQTGNRSYNVEYKYSRLKDIGIIHFTTGKKPWNTKGLPLSEEFWRYAAKTPFYEDIILTYATKTLKLDRPSANTDERARRNLINGHNQLHYEVINPAPYERKLLITWPFRMMAKFFASWRREGIRSTVKKISPKLKYVFNRILRRVDKDNNNIIK